MSRRVALPAAALLLSTCGGPDPQALVDGAVEALETAGTSSFEMEVVAAPGQEPSAPAARPPVLRSETDTRRSRG